MSAKPRSKTGRELYYRYLPLKIPCGRNRRRFMHPDELYTATRRQPFLPFRLHVSDGSSYDIRHPEMILVTRRSAILALPGGVDPILERALTVALVHITRIEELAATPTSGNNAAS